VTSAQTPDDPSRFSWGPDRRVPPVGASSAAGFLALAIIAVLAAGILSAAVHHKSKTTAAPAVATTPPKGTGTVTTAPAAATTTVVTPPGFERLLDQTDHLSLAVPAGWEAPGVSNTDLTGELKAMANSDPTLAPVLDIAIGALSRIQIGVFAVDISTRTTLYAYGVAVPGVTSVTQIPSTDVIKQVQSVGGKNVHYNQVQLPVGLAGQISAELVVSRTTISEALDYFVQNGHLVTLVVATRGTKAPVSTLNQIQATLANA
jgi:hypothetical protein